MPTEGAVVAGPAVRFGPRRVGHVNLFVADYLRSTEFYRDVCGFWMSGVEPKVNAAFFTNGWTHHDIGIVQVRERGVTIARTGRVAAPPDYGQRVGLNHFGWEMESERDLVEAYRRACAIGMLMHRVTDQGNSLSCYLFDDDGFNHQFYANKSRDWRSIFTGGTVDLHGNPEWKPGESTPSAEPNYDVEHQICRNEAAPLHPIRLTHAVMVSDRFPTMRDFYRQTAGLESRAASSSMDYLAGPASRVDIVLVDARGRRPGMHHASFELSATEDLEESSKALARRGVAVARRVELAHKSSLFIQDPDGILLEFYIPRATPLPPVRDDGSEAALYNA